MYKLGEYPIVAKFPTNQSAFSITFYGSSGIGDAHITIFKSNGAVLAKHIIKNVNNGPHGFSSPTENIAGFSLYNTDVGGLAIYEIRYKNFLMQEPYFLDTFGA